MRIVYVTYCTPWSPKYGGTMRNYGILRGLVKRAEVHVVFVSSNLGDISFFKKESARLPVIKHVIQPSPKWESIDDKAASRSLRAVLGGGKFREGFLCLIYEIAPDIVWYFETETIHRVGKVRGIPTILDFVDVKWLKLMSYARESRDKKALSNFLKASIARLDDVILSRSMTTSLVAGPQEASSLWPTKNVKVVPNGYDFPEEPILSIRTTHQLIFIGSLFYLPNKAGLEWFCRDVWPLVRREFHDATLSIVGLGGEELEKYDGQSGVQLCGWIDDLEPLIANSAGLVVPLKVGGGTRIKILEAWAKGLPVVSTSVGAEGLGIVNGETALIGDTPEELARACVSLLGDPILGMQLAERGFAHGKALFDWPIIHQKLDEIIENVAAKAARLSWNGCNFK